MTAANKITIGRIALIPVFVVFAIYYGRGVAAGRVVEWMRWAALGAFAIAAISDGLDGFIARRFNQRTELGVLLDPIADKGLLLAGIITLSFSRWAYEIPVWFAVLVVGRDLIVGTGALVLVMLQGTTAIRTTWTGKTATALQMVVLVLAMLQPGFLRRQILFFGNESDWVWLDIPVLVAAVFTAISGVGYSTRALRQLHLGGHGDPTPWPVDEKKRSNPFELLRK